MDVRNDYLNILDVIEIRIDCEGSLIGGKLNTARYRGSPAAIEGLSEPQ